MTLQFQFHAVCASIGVPIDLADSWLARINAAYAEQGRAYHTAQHIDSMLNHPLLVGQGHTLPIATTLAIVFHDAVYDPLRKDNELQSAAVFADFAAAGGLPSDLVARVCKLIMCTEKHRLSDELADDEAAKVFLDLDLSILAAPDAVYDDYAAAIRVEYSHVPDDMYRSGRVAVLRSLTARDVFLSPLFHTEHMEAAAKRNVEREIASLLAASSSSSS